MSSNMMTDNLTSEHEVPTRHWIALFGGLIGAFMAILDIQIINSSLKDIQGALSATLDEAHGYRPLIWSQK